MLKIFILLQFLFIMFSCTAKEDTVVIETNHGSFTMQVNHRAAPKHAANFIKLVKNGFYDGTTFHKIISGTLIQGGDPLTKDDDLLNDGLGNPGYSLDQEFGRLRHVKGAVAAVKSKNESRKSNGSQFYICLSRIKVRDGNRTVFGKVIENLEVAERISWAAMDFQNRPKKPIQIIKAYLK